jgi:hypothetical protein
MGMTKNMKADKDLHDDVKTHIPEIEQEVVILSTL